MPHTDSHRSARRAIRRRMAVPTAVLALALAVPFFETAFAGPVWAAPLPAKTSFQDLYLVPAAVEVSKLEGVSIHDYGGATLMQLPATGALAAAVRSRIKSIDGLGTTSYRGWTVAPEPIDPAARIGDGYYVLALTGPLDPAWARGLELAGLSILTKANPYGLLVRGDGEALARAAELRTSGGYAVVLGAAAVPRQARLAPSLVAVAEGRIQPAELGMRTDGSGRGAVVIEIYSDRDSAAILGRIAEEVPLAPILGDGHDSAFLVEGGDLERLLERQPGIAWIEPVFDKQLNNNLAAKDYIMNVEPIWTDPGLGYNGSGVIVGINDSGADPAHADFQDPTYGDVFIATNGTMGGTGNFHGTHVSGSVLGRGYASGSPINSSGCGDQTPPLPLVRGMAWGAQGTHNNIFSGGIGTVTGMMEWSYQQGARLNTNSWGYCAPCGTACACGPATGYSTNTADADAAVRDADGVAALNQQLMIFFSAGNDGASGVGSPGNGKNMLTVGASQNDRCGSYVPSQCPGPDIDSMACFSSLGPSQQRFKPDVAAPGTDVLSVDSTTAAGGWDQAWTGADYGLSPGTSMSTPLTAGCGAVFYDFYGDVFAATPSPALIKAAIINGAEDMGFGFPSNTAGWGLVNCRQALEGPPGGQIQFFDQGDVTHLTTGQTWSTQTTCNSTSPRLKVSLVWTDPPGSAGCNPCDVNDLDLVVTGPGGTVYRGNQFAGSWSQPNPGPTTDTLNNVENVFVQNPALGNWSIDVDAAQVTTNPLGLSGQDFAVVISGDCSDCTPPAAPSGLTASATVANQIDLSWTASPTPGVTDYNIHRATSPGGPYTQVGTVSAPTTTFSDTTVSGGTTYYYVVRAVLTCESADSNEDSATAFGDCTTDPTFSGLQTVNDIAAGGSCGLRLEWSAATNNCGGEPVVYNVYRSTNAIFTPDSTPGSGNMIASCVTGTFYDDTTVTGGTPYYYVVRAEDAELGGGGPCQDGNEETNSTRVSDTSGAPTTNTLYTNDFESGTGLDDWGRKFFTGDTLPNNWRGIQTCTANSGTDIFRFGGTSCAADYTATQRELAEPLSGTGIAVPASATNTTLSFAHRRQFEFGYDGANLWVSLDGSTYTLVVAGEISGTNYNGTVLNFCPVPNTVGQPIFTGTATTFSTSTVDLDAVCDRISGGSGGCAGQTIWTGFVSVTDCSVFGDGWFLDDVEITVDVPGSCSAGPGAAQFLTATATDGQNVLEWLNPASGGYGSTMIRYATGSYPADPTDGTLLVDQNDGLGTKGTTIHGSLTNNTTYYYSAFVDNGSGEYSARKTVSARPFDTSGSVNWAYSTGASALTPPGIGSVYGVANDRVLHSMDTSGGGTWPSGWTPLAMNGPAQARPPIVPISVGAASKVAFLGSQDHRVYAVDADTGSAVWSSPDLGAIVQGAPGGIYTAFGGAYDLILAGTRNSAGGSIFYGLDLTNGSIAWSYTNAIAQGGDDLDIGVISGGPLVDWGPRRVYFTSRARAGGSSDTVWCLDFTDSAATRLWSRALGDVDGSLILFGGRLYVGTNASEVHALDPATGADLWTQPFDASDGPIKSYIWPRFGTSELLFSTTNRLWSITDNGTGATVNANWPETAIPNPSIPLIFNVGGTPYVWVGSSDGRLYQLDLSAVDPPASRTSVVLGDGSATVGSPALDIADQTLYVGTEEGRLYAVTLPLP